MRQKDEEERERIEEETQQFGDDDVRDRSSLSDDKKGEQVVFTGRGDLVEDEKDDTDDKENNNKEKDRITKDNEFENKNRRFMSPTKPTEKRQNSPVSYAGWKPSDIP